MHNQINWKSHCSYTTHSMCGCVKMRTVGREIETCTKGTIESGEAEADCLEMCTTDSEETHCQWRNRRWKICKCGRHCQRQTRPKMSLQVESSVRTPKPEGREATMRKQVAKSSMVSPQKEPTVAVESKFRAYSWHFSVEHGWSTFTVTHVDHNEDENVIPTVVLFLSSRPRGHQDRPPSSSLPHRIHFTHGFLPSCPFSSHVFRYQITSHE